MQNYRVSDFDREIWAAELENFVPARVFDAHTHIWNERFATAATPESGLRLNCGPGELQRWSEMIFPGRETHFFLLATPLPAIRQPEYRDWCIEAGRRDPANAVAVIAAPEITPEALAEAARKGEIRGLKPYRCYAPDQDTCGIRDFLPESLIEVADAFGLVIVLHLSKRDGIADAGNIRDLEYFTRRYPRVTWQLAHCARAFHPFMLEKSIHRLKHLDHLCYDISAVCESHTLALLLKYEDRRRILYGSDNISDGADVGKYVAWGRGWDCFPGNPATAHCDGRATLVVYENLRALRQAAELFDLTAKEVEDIFYHNAQRIIRPQKPV